MIEEFFSPLFITDWGRRLGIGVMIAALLSLIIAIINLFFTGYQDFFTTQAQPDSALPKQLSSNQAQTFWQQIPAQHLFGFNATAANMPITSLQLQLVGVIQTDRDHLSRVLISTKGQAAKVFQVGDVLSNEVRIDAIEADGVILENAGHREKLPLPRPPLQFQGMPKKISEG